MASGQVSESDARGHSNASERLTLALMVFSFLLLVGIRAWAWTVAPGTGLRAALSAGALLLIAIFLELHWRRLSNLGTAQAHRRFLRLFFAAMTFAVAVRYGTSAAVTSGLMDSGWREFGYRFTGVTSGAAFAVFGNYLPKLVSPWALEDEPFDWQGVHRFCGHAFLVGGTAVAIFWLVLTYQQAKLTSLALLFAVALACVLRKFYSLATWPVHRRD